MERTLLRIPVVATISMWPPKNASSSIAKPTCQIFAVRRPKIAAMGGWSGECFHIANPLATISGAMRSSTSVYASFCSGL
jgi:hypothetical protein